MILDVLLLFFFKHLLDFIPSGSNLPGSDCYWKFPMHFSPFALSLRGISIHFFSLSWAIENTVGARRPPQTKKYFFGGKKCKIELVIGWQTWSEVILKLCGIGWGAANRSPQDEEKWGSLKARFCVPFVRNWQYYFGGVGHHHSHWA